MKKVQLDIVQLKKITTSAGKKWLIISKSIEEMTQFLDCKRTVVNYDSYDLWRQQK